MIYKILLAINNQIAENKIKEKVEQINPNYTVVGQVVAKDSIDSFLEEKSVDILMIMENSTGPEDDFDYVIKLKRKYPKLRIIFMSNTKSCGDKDLARLVTFQIYDILSGGSFLLDDMVNKILHESTFEDAMIYLPDEIAKDGVFNEDELKKSGQPTEKQLPGKVELSVEELEENKKTTKKEFGISLKDKLTQKKPTIPNLSIPVPITKNNDKPKNPETVVDNEKLLKLQEQLKKSEEKNRKIQEEKERLEKEKKQADKEKERILKEQKKMSEEYDKTIKEMLDKDKQRDQDSKQKIIMFYGAVPGSGNSTAALNVATYLAMAGSKVVYIEFNDIIPTLSYYYDLGGIESCLEKAFLGIETRNYNDINESIVTKDKILSLETRIKDRQTKYPEKLHYLFFSESYIKRGDINTVNPNTVKDLLLFLLYKNGFDYIVLDIYSHSNFNILSTASIFSSYNVFTLTQDVATLGATAKVFAGLRSSGIDFEMFEGKAVKDSASANYKNIYLINKYNNNIKFSKKEYRDWLESSKVVTIPDNFVDTVNSANEGLPSLLISKNKDYLVSIKNLADMFK